MLKNCNTCVLRLFHDRAQLEVCKSISRVCIMSNVTSQRVSASCPTLLHSFFTGSHLQAPFCVIVGNPSRSAGPHHPSGSHPSSPPPFEAPGNLFWRGKLFLAGSMPIFFFLMFGRTPKKQRIHSKKNGFPGRGLAGSDAGNAEFKLVSAKRETDLDDS